MSGIEHQRVISRIVIATDDSRIYDTRISFGAECQMTSSDHTSGSDRIMEVCRSCELLDSEVVVNLQGDEPFMSPLLIDQLVENKESHAEFGVATMCEEIIDPDLLTQPSVVKVLFDSEGKALSFSRISDPMHRAGVLRYKHLGIYAYSVAILKKFISLKNIRVSVLFVCLGNICRSPTAHAVFRQLVDDEYLNEFITVDSAGTGDWHIGCPPDKRSSEAASQRGYDLSDLRARLVTKEDFYSYDHILVMDKKNFRDVSALAPNDLKAKISLFLDYSLMAKESGLSEVPDPYYGGDDGFDRVLSMIEDGSRGFLSSLKNEHEFLRD